MIQGGISCGWVRVYAWGDIVDNLNRGYRLEGGVSRIGHPFIWRGAVCVRGAIEWWIANPVLDR